MSPDTAHRAARLLRLADDCTVAAVAIERGDVDADAVVVRVLARELRARGVDDLLAVGLVDEPRPAGVAAYGCRGCG